MTDSITATAFHAAPGTDDWRVIGDGACTFFRTSSFAASTRLVRAIGELALDDHPPAVDIRRDGVTVRLVTSADDWFGMSQRDVASAQAISEAARKVGARVEPSNVSSLTIIIEAEEPARVMPFWEALLGFGRRPDSAEEDLVDPRDRLPGFWFETIREPHPNRGGMHVALWVPSDQAEARVAAALAAGGRMVRDQFAPAWWTLADAEGNQADVASIATRE
jgi:4a-hydroxytetrahydrobiopterin dehydratase